MYMHTILYGVPLGSFVFLPLDPIHLTYSCCVGGQLSFVLSLIRCVIIQEMLPPFLVLPCWS